MASTAAKLDEIESKIDTTTEELRFRAKKLTSVLTDAVASISDELATSARDIDATVGKMMSLITTTTNLRFEKDASGAEVLRPVRPPPATHTAHPAGRGPQ